MSIVKKINVTELVDRLGRIKADIADLEAKEKEAIEELKALGVGERDGKLFHSNVFLQNRSTVDWKAVVAEAKIPTKLLLKHTDSKEITVCKITAR